MPNQDGKGPRGEGPLTGRGRGRCDGGGRGRRSGRGYGFRRGRGGGWGWGDGCDGTHRRRREHARDVEVPLEATEPDETATEE